MNDAKNVSHKIPFSSRWIVLASIVALALVGSYLNSRLVYGEFSDFQKKEPGASVQGSLQLWDADRKSYEHSFKSADLHLITFWATWCPPCIRELPEMAQLATRFKPQELNWVPINVESESSPEELKKFWQNLNIGNTFWRDQKTLNQERLSVDVLPTTLIVDNEGKIRFLKSGYSDWTSPGAQAFVDSLLKKP